MVSVRPLAVVSNVLFKHENGEVLILMGKRSKDGLWCTPGGKVERETISEAGRREQLEETGMTLLGDPVLLTVTEDIDSKKKSEQHHVVVHLSWPRWSGEPFPAEPSHTEWKWFTIKKAITLRLKPGTRKLIEYLTVEAW